VTSALAAPAVGNGFVATATTVNNGTANLTGGATDDTTIDVSLAGGANGFNLVGGTSDLLGLDTLIGSARADLINGGNNDQQVGSQDTLTGKGGADVFQFNTNTSIPAAMTSQVQLPLPVDQEVITVDRLDGSDEGTETITIQYTLNGTAAPDLVIPATAFNPTELASMNAAIAAALDLRPGIRAEVSLGTVIVANEAGTINSVTIDSVAPTGAGWDAVPPDFFSWVDGADVAQVERLNIANTAVTAGEVYRVDVTNPDGSGFILQYTALDLDDNEDVANGLVASYGGQAAISAVANADGGTWGITFQRVDANDGGFRLTTAAQGSFDGSGASDKGATTLASADLITDFVSGTDKVDLNLVAGSATNYKEAAEVADFAAARALAVAQFNLTVQYFLTSIPDNPETAVANDATGLLFFDANADGLLDGVVAMTGISETNFAASDIIA
jgi:hypothetical protein